MASRLGKKVGGAVAGFFRGGADNTAPTLPKQPDKALAKGAVKPPKTGSHKLNSKVSTVQPQPDLAPNSESETLKTELSGYAKRLKSRQKKLSKIADTVTANTPLKASRVKLNKLANGMVDDVDNFCRDKLQVNLSEKLCAVDFSRAQWKTDLLTALGSSLEAAFPGTSQHVAQWLLDQILATGSVCLGALEKDNDAVFRQYVTSADGAVREQWDRISERSKIDSLISGWTDSSTHDDLRRAKAFLEKLKFPAIDEIRSEVAFRPVVKNVRPPKKKDLSLDSSDSSHEENREKGTGSGTRPKSGANINFKRKGLLDSHPQVQRKKSNSSMRLRDEEFSLATKERMSTVNSIALGQQKEFSSTSSSEG